MNAREFSKLYEAHHGLLHYWVLGQMRNQSQAEDIVSKAFSAAWEHRNSLLDPAKFKGWLYAIAYNEMKTFQRHASVIVWEPLEGVERSDPKDFTEELAKYMEWKRAAQVTAILSEAHRAALVCHLKGLTVTESAKQLRVAQGTYASRLFNAQKKLRELCNA